MFFGDSAELKKFIDDAEAAFTVVIPNKHGILLKFVESRIVGDIRYKLFVARNKSMRNEN